MIGLPDGNARVKAANERPHGKKPIIIPNKSISACLFFEKADFSSLRYPKILSGDAMAIHPGSLIIPNRARPKTIRNTAATKETAI